MCDRFFCREGSRGARLMPQDDGTHKFSGYRSAVPMQERQGRSSVPFKYSRRIVGVAASVEFDAALSRTHLPSAGREDGFPRFSRA